MPKKVKGNPIVLANTEWMPPDWLLREVRAERMIINLHSMAKPDHFKEDADYVGDTECLAYMMPATGIAPLDRDNAEIYFYLATKVMKNVKKIDVPEDIKVTELNDYRMGLLKDLKRWLYKQRNGKVSSPIVDALTEVFGRETKQLAIF